MRLMTILGLGAALGAIASATAAASAQEGAGASKAAVSSSAPAGWTPPKNAMGQPDISGFWSSATLTPLTRDPKLGDKASLTAAEAKAKESSFAEGLAQRDAQVTDLNSLPGNAQDKEKDAKLIATRADFGGAGGAVGGYNTYWLDPGTHLVELNGEFRTSILTTANGQTPPRKAGGSGGQRPAGGGGGQFQEAYDSYEVRGLGDRCITSFGRNSPPPMLPNGYYNNNYQIVQTPDAVVINVEMIHDTRVIRLDSTHRTDGVRPYMGDSIGRYEGNSLVVETTNIPQSQNFMGSWKTLKVTEWFTRISPTKVVYRFQIDDPDLWEKPWGGEYTFLPLGGRIYEYACHEGNYALPGILGGARELERRAAATSKPAATRVP